MAKLTILGHLQSALQAVKSYVLNLVGDVVDATTDEVNRVDSRIDTVWSAINDVETQVVDLGSWSPQIYQNTDGTTNITSSFNINYVNAVRVMDLCYVEFVFAPKNYVSSGTKVGAFTLPYARNANTEASYPFNTQDSIVVKYGSSGDTTISGYSLSSAPGYRFISQISLVTPADKVYVRGWYRIASSSGPSPSTYTIGQRLKWTKLGSVTGTTAITLPSEWTELACYLHYGTNTTSQLHVIPNTGYSRTYRTVLGHYNNTSDYRCGTVEVNPTTNKVAITLYKNGVNDVTASAELDVYYR